MELTSLLYFAYAIFGIGIVIFIHELGHFLAAKRVGVRVETFCLGFDPVIRGRRLRLFSFRRGETVYAIGAIPFGGYVKMAGETPFERKENPEAPRAGDELMAKPAGSRALVFAAGAAFNIISAFIFFMLAFRIGVSFTAPVIGMAEPGRPAWSAGLRQGDQVEAIDGKPINDFHEIAISSALGDPGRPRLFTVRRGDRLLDPLSIVPQWTPEFGFHTIGVTPLYDSQIEEVTKGSAAAELGVRVGDRFAGLKLGGVLVSGPPALTGPPLSEYLMVHPDGEFEVGIDRPGEPQTIWKTVRLKRKPSPTPTPRLGVMPAASVVEAVQPGSGLEGRLAPGDRVKGAGGKPLPSLDWLSVLEALGPGGPVELEVESVDGKLRKVAADTAEVIRWSLDRQVKWGNQTCRVLSLREGSPFAQALRPGDLVVALGSPPEPVFDPDRFAEALKRESGELLVWYRRGEETASARVVWREVGRADPGIEWDRIPPARVLPQSPAAAAGIQSGSRIVAVEGRPVRSWSDFQAAVRQADPSRASVKWIPAAGGEPRQAPVNLLSGEQAGYEELGVGLRYLQRRIQAGILESFELGAKRTVVVGEDVFLTLKGLISRQVAAKNLAGPVGIINLIYQVSEYGIGTLIYYLALISVNLGLFNLLPFPILDGGHLLFLGIEKIKGSPVDVRVQEVATTVAFFLIIGLALFVTYNDLLRLFGR
jgi:regulator of sigma E protease